MEFDKPLVRAHSVIYGFSKTDNDYTFLLTLKEDFDDVDDTAKKRMVFFIVLNTKMKISELLTIDPYVSYISQICRRLDFKALGYTIFNLKMCKYLNPIARNSPAAFTIEVFKGIFPHVESRDQLQGLEYVMPALLQKILKILRNDHKEKGTTYKLWELLNTCVDMMWNKDKIKGQALSGKDAHLILEICLACIYIFDGRVSLSFDPMFEIKMLEPPSKKYDFELRTDPDSRVEFREFLRRLLHYFDEILKNCSPKSISETDRRRMSIKAYVICEKLDQSDFKPRNVSCLNNIKRKPNGMRDGVSRIDVDTIISFTECGPGSDIWLRCLIYLPDSLKNEKAVACIRKHLILVDSKDLKTLGALIEEELQQNSITEALTDLYFVALNKMTLEDQVSRLENTLTLERKFQYDESVFDKTLTEAFNQINTTAPRSISLKKKLVKLCILSPLKTIKRICQQALFNNSELDNSVEDLKMLKPACVFKDPSSEGSDLNLITSILYDMLDNEQYEPKKMPLLKSLILKLQKEKILGKAIEACVMKIVHKDLEARKYDTAGFALDILASLIKTKSFGSNKVVTLAFLSQILNRASWSCTSFSVKLEQIRETSITCIRSILEKPGLSPTAQELAWLRTKIMKCDKINRLYFTDLWPIYDKELIPSDLHVQILLLIHSKIRAESTCEFVMGHIRRLGEMAFTTTLAAILLQVLPVLTSSEWLLVLAPMKSIVYNWLETRTGRTDDRTISLGFFQIMTKSLYCLALDMSENRDSMPCFSFCIRNFGRIIENDFLADENLDCEAANIIVQELMLLLNGIEDSDVQLESSIALCPVITGLVNRFAANETSRNNYLKTYEEWFKREFLRVNVE